MEDAIPAESLASRMACCSSEPTNFGFTWHPLKELRGETVFGVSDEEQNGEKSGKVCGNRNNHYRRGRVLGI